VGGLLAALAFAYYFPVARLEVSARAAGAIEIGIFSVPVLFAGLLFSSEFKKTASPSAALNANVLGGCSRRLIGELVAHVRITISSVDRHRFLLLGRGWIAVAQNWARDEWQAIVWRIFGLGLKFKRLVQESACP